MNFLAPPPILLPPDELIQPVTEESVLSNPASPLGWATLAEQAFAQLDDATDSTDPAAVVAYAFARTGYHRSLDRLRANGWKGHGPVPFDHVPNQGVLRSIAILAKLSALINDTQEYERCRTMLIDADPSCVERLLG